MYLFVGLSTVDIHYHLDRLPADNEKIKVATPDVVMGDPAANAAITCAALGGKSKIVTAIGDHPLGEVIKNDFNQFGVVFIDVWKGLNVQPTLASVFSNHKSGDRAIISHYPPTPEINYWMELKSIDFSKVRYVLIDGFHPEITLPICKKAKEHGALVVFDGGSWKPYLNQLLPLIDIAICSNDFYPPGCSNTREVVEYLKVHSIHRIAITSGSAPIFYQTGESEGQIEIPETKVVDTSGAGDVFHGAFMYYLSIYEDFSLVLEEASKIASFKCRFKGTRTWIEKNS